MENPQTPNNTATREAVADAPPVSILIVEDDPGHVELIRRAFESYGGTVQLTVARTVREARNSLSRSTPDLVISDLRLPDGDALELLAIARLSASFPVVVMTGQGDEAVAVRAMKAGAVDYVVKSESSFVEIPRTAISALREWGANLDLKHTTRELLEQHVDLKDVARKLADANLELAQEARLDPLTNLLNRRAWEESVRLEVERSRRCDLRCCILMIDLDHFKLLNDSAGHPAGDDCLRKVAGAIRDACRAFDIVGRYGGEEFVLLLPETNAEGALASAERIRKAVWQLAFPHPRSPDADRVTATVGVAVVCDKGVEAALEMADAALYQAKHDGRNRVCLNHESAPLGTREQTPRRNPGELALENTRKDRPPIRK